MIDTNDEAVVINGNPNSLFVVDLLVDPKSILSVVFVMPVIAGVVLSISEWSVLPVEYVEEYIPGVLRY